MKYRALGRTGLQLSPFGLSLDGAGVGAHPAPQSANWCDIRSDIDKADWGRLAALLAAPGSTRAGSASVQTGSVIVQARVGPDAWDRHMLMVCEALLAQTRLSTIHLWQLDGFDLERIKGGEPFNMMQRLRDAGRIGFFSVRVESPVDALWLIENAPVHAITLDADLDTREWHELIGIAAEAGVGLIATARCVRGESGQAWRLLHESSIASFAWPIGNVPNHVANCR